MFKLILKKQLLEIGTFYIKDRKTGAKLKGGKMLGMLALWGGCFISLFFAGFGMCELFGDAFFKVGLDWFFFITMGMTSIVMGVFGSVFNTYASIYKAKDNDLLLSMPIKPSSILSAKVTVTYIMSMVFSCIFYIPTIIYYYTHVDQTVMSVVGSLLMFIVINIISTALVCILGYFIALASYKLKGKQYVTVILTIAFMGAYYYFYFKLNSYLQYIATNGELFAENIKGKAKLVYMFGHSFVGDVPSLLLYAGISIVFLGIVYFVLSRRYLKIMTTNRGEKKVEYNAEKAIKSKSVSSALLSKELARFTKSTVYLLNSGLGVLMLVAAGILLVFRADYVKSVVVPLEAQIPGVSELFPLFILAIMMMLCSTVLITAPSISLEGKNIWVLKSLPVATIDIFNAKKKLQNVLGVPAAIIFTGLCSYAFDVKFETAVFLILTSVVYMMLVSSLGLMVNLLFPNLEWKDETVPVKQGLSILVMMFGGWAVVVLLGALYYFVFADILESPDQFIVGLMVVFVICGRLVNNWLMKQGVKRWEEL